MPPNLLAHYPYLWEPTVVRQAIETAWSSASEAIEQPAWGQVRVSEALKRRSRDGFRPLRAAPDTARKAA